MKKLTVKKEAAKRTRAQRASAFVEKYAYVFVLAFVFCLMCGGIAGAATADTAWNAVMGEAMKWIARLGIVVVVIGAIMFGLGFKNDDAEQKTRGLGTMVAGGIVGGVCLVAGPLLTV